MPISGMMTPSTRLDTILPNAAPITTPTARSTTLPRIAKVLNSASSPMASSGVAASCRRRRIAPSPDRERSDDAPGELELPVEAGAKRIAPDERRNACRRAGVDQVAGRQRVELRQLRDDVGHAEDHVGDVGFLPALPVDLEPERTARGVADRRGRRDRRDR